MLNRPERVSETRVPWRRLLAAVTVSCLLTRGSVAANESTKLVLPPLKPQATAIATFNEHISALNSCDWPRLMAQYPPQVQLHLPDGAVAKGREAVAKLFTGFVKPRAAGGLCGLHFSTVSLYAVGGTLNVEWRATARFLKRPYLGSDAYVTRDGLMYAQVSTFRGSDLQFK